MTTTRPILPAALRTPALAAGLLVLLAHGAVAQDVASAALAEAQAAANAEVGPRQVPSRVVPVPEEGVSPELQALIAAPYGPFWAASGTSADEWRAFSEAASAAAEPGLAELREALGVTLEEATIGGVPCLILTPGSVPEGAPGSRAGQTVLNLHGGGYVYGGGVGGTYEATLMAA